MISKTINSILNEHPDYYVFITKWADDPNQLCIQVCCKDTDVRISEYRLPDSATDESIRVALRVLRDACRGWTT